MIQLYDYFRSSASFRVRIALNLKGLSYEKIPISLTAHEQSQADYLLANPQGLVPTLNDNGKIISQSLAIIDYLEEKYPSPSLLPSREIDRAKVKSMALYIACEIHPLNNLRVREYLKEEKNFSEAAILDWCQHWISVGFKSIESELSRAAIGDFCFGSKPTLADVCLIPQIYNAKRVNLSMHPFPRIESVYKHCLEQTEFKAALP